MRGLLTLVLRNAFGRAVLMDLGAAILFFGVLVHHDGLQECATRAVHELQSYGYVVPTAADPLRIYPANTAASFSSGHAGGWRPGVISLRESPQGGIGPEVYLRHELMHEASFRSCGGRLPLWAEEAAAMSFSGELAWQSSAQELIPGELQSLRRRVRAGASLDQEGYRVLSQLVARYGWPQKPCTVSEDIEKLLASPGRSPESGFSHTLIHLLSGQALESKGDINGRFPPGSLLKIPYAAALKDCAAEVIGAELAASDTSKLLQRKANFDLDTFRLIISVVPDTPLGQSVSPIELAGKDGRFWRRYLGERAEDGLFPLEASLPELALMLRISLLYRPGYFRGMAQNGFVTGSTLYGEPEQDKRVLSTLHALAKTGTVADERGNPLVGHLMVAWPADNPAYLAVFRSLGVPGAANLRRASKVLEGWAQRFPGESGTVRIKMLSLTPRASWEVVDECPSLSVEDDQGRKRRVSTCCGFRVLSTARGSRSERLAKGVFEFSADDQVVILETDPETYADGVLAAEAADLQGEARKALRAVIVWNATHGGRRHADTGALCDTTHCMVFRGEVPGHSPKRGPATDRALTDWLDGFAQKQGLDWLSFSKGGTQPWEQTLPTADLLKLVAEPTIIEMRRERTRSGEVVVHLVYPDAEELIPCESFRNRLKLYSCPETIRPEPAGDAWVFAGVGEGHSQGLSVERARALAAAGRRAVDILTDAYQVNQ
jgi:peptidoglycan hydrolase-like amidase